MLQRSHLHKTRSTICITHVQQYVSHTFNNMYHTRSTICITHVQQYSYV